SVAIEKYPTRLTNMTLVTMVPLMIGLNCPKSNNPSPVIPIRYEGK
ncbi:MAG: hypothetical protein ACI8UP_005192, partial [Porticoccaceae bacterium]